MSNGSFDDYLAQQADNPAESKGQKHLTETTPGIPAALQGSVLGNYLAHNDPSQYTQQTSQWFTGANPEGTDNGFDTQFVHKFIDGWNQALESGTAKTYFDNPGATGIVSWDHTSADGTRTYKFGDVYENGKSKGNLYDQYDKNTANLMMAPFILDNDTQAHAFADNDRLDKLDQEIQKQHADRNQNFEASLTALEFQGDVKKRQEAFQKGFGVDDDIVLGGAAGGAALGAGLGSVVPGIGTGTGAVVGGIVGGVGAYLNKDALSEQAARAYEITKMSYDQYGFKGGLTTGISQWSGFAGKAISPLDNLAQGLYDAKKGTVGDGQSEYYKVDAQGNNHTPTWMKAVDVGATIGDSLLQFASPIGASLYSLQMSGTIAGEVGELGATGGSTFDYNTGKFDNIFKDRDGNVDWVAGAAGIGKIGIDAVQLGMARGLLSGTNSRLEAAGENSLYRTTVGTLGTNLGKRIPLALGGTRGLAAGETRVAAGGYKFTRDAEGAIVPGSGNASLEILAPSEALVALSARVMGMRAAAKAGHAFAADDFYRAAHALHSGERKFTNALVTAFGEGSEEVIQQILEPRSHNESTTFSQLAQAGLYGAAAGLGMGVGATVHAPSADRQMYAAANVVFQMENGGAELEKSEWDAMSPINKRAMAARTGVLRETAEAAARQLVREQAITTSMGVVGAAKLQDAVQASLSSALKTATSGTDHAFVITQLESSPELDDQGRLMPGAIPNDGIAGSAMQTAQNMLMRATGLQIQLGSLQQTLQAQQAELAANPADPDLPGKITATQKQIDSTELALQWAAKLNQAIDPYMVRMANPAATQQQVEADSAELNDLLLRAFTQDLHDFQGVPLTDDDKFALSYATAQLWPRDPHDSATSYQVLVPQVSAKLTMSRANNVMEISHSILTSLRADYDGDKLRELNQLIIDRDSFENLRSGAHYIGAGVAAPTDTDPEARRYSVNIPAPAYEEYNLTQLAEWFGSGNAAKENHALGVLLGIGTAIHNRYDDTIGADVLDPILAKFYAQAKAGTKDARASLLDGLADHAGQELNLFGRANNENQWLWLDALVTSSLQAFQETYAAHVPDLQRHPNTTDAIVNTQEPEVKARMSDRASQAGLTLSIWAAGDSLFRKFQKLHYSVHNAPVSSGETRETYKLTEMGEIYREIGAGTTRSELENIRGKDDITDRVYVQLQKIAADAQRINPRLNRYEAIALIANTRVQNFDIDIDGVFTDKPGEVTLAQILLKQSIMVDRREKDRIFEASDELQSKHARLLKMTRPQSNRYGYGAEEAFLEIIGAQQIYTILGDEAMAFGPHLTFEQYLRQYIDGDERKRRETANALRDNPYYLKPKKSDKKSKSMPYNLDDIMDADGSVQLSPYTAVVDSILAVGNNRLSIDKTKLNADLTVSHLTGEYADRNAIVSKNIKTFHARVRDALREFSALQGRQDGELTTELIGRMIEDNPDFGRRVMDLMPNASTSAFLQVRDGQVFGADWLYEMFADADADRAEMLYYRNLLLTEWNALSVNAHLNEEGEEGHSAREFDRLPRRMMRVMYRLAKNNDGGLRLQQFLNKLEGSNNLEDFMRWVNFTPGIRGTQAPIVAWFDDTAEFDKDKAQGGWTTQLRGAELREAIASLKTSSENLVQSLKAERSSLKADEWTLDAIERVLDVDDGVSGVTLDSNDRALADRFKAVLDRAPSRKISVGPQAMINQTMGAVIGLNAQSHTKGVSATNVEPFATFEAQRDGYGYELNYERQRGALTTVNMDDVSNNLPLASQGGRTMDDEGRVVEWSQYTPRQMLDLLRNPQTRPMARGLLFPQVMERGQDNVMRPQLLLGTSLTDLLDNEGNKSLFPRNDTLSQPAAFKYALMLEGETRNFGGNLALQRVVNDIVLARTSISDHVMTVKETEASAVRTYHEVAEIMQAVGALYSQDPTGKLLDDYLEYAQKTQRKLRMAHVLGANISQVEDFTDEFLDSLLLQKERETTEAITAITALAATDTGRDSYYQAQIAAITDEQDRFSENVKLLRTDDVAGMAAEMFTIKGDANEQDVKKAALVEYIRGRWSMLQSATATKQEFAKLSRQLLDPAYGGVPQLTDKEWSAISRAVIADYLSNTSATAAAGVSVSPYPDADHSDDMRYFDRSYSYLAAEMLRSDGPLALGAREVHRVSGRQGEAPPSMQDFFNLLGRTVFDEKRLGPWTPELVSVSMEANARLDSDAAAAALSIAGDSVKRMATILAATRRTYDDPGAAQLSNVSLTWDELGAADNHPVSVTLPGGTVVQRPLIQLTNRFAKNVSLEYLDATGATQTVDLLNLSRQLGRQWLGNDEVSNSGYFEVSVLRLQRAADQAMRQLGLNPDGVKITMDFFHPDTQPADMPHNIYFEGTNFRLDADVQQSLLAGLWFWSGSQSPAAQAAALDAAKKGLAALQVIETASPAQRVAMEAAWTTDFAGMLRTKTRTLLETDFGFGRIDPEFHNAVYKDMKIHHYVRDTGADGEAVLYTAEQIINSQLGTGPDIQLSPGATLWVPSDDVLRSMFGEQGTQGVAKVFDDQLEINPSRIKTFRGLTPTILDRFALGLSGAKIELKDTRVSARSRMGQLTVRTMLDDTLQNVFDQKMIHLRELADVIYNDRGDVNSKFDANANLSRVVAAADTMLRAEDVDIHWPTLGLPFGPRHATDPALSQMVLRDQAAAMAQDGFRTGWVLRAGSKAQPQVGILNERSLGNPSREAYRVAPGDLVLVELSSFAGDTDLAHKMIDHLVNNGAIIVLATEDASSDMRAEVAEYLVGARQYEPIAGSKHAYQPPEYNSRFQNQRARISTLTETRGINMRNRLALLLVDDKDIQEGALWVDDANENLGGYTIAPNLVPASATAGFNAPIEDLTNESQVLTVRQHLKSFDNIKGRKFLADQANGFIKDKTKRAKADDEFNAALDEMYARFDANPGTLFPPAGAHFGKGSILPLVDSRGRVLLYRHGFKALNRSMIDYQTSLAYSPEEGALNVAVFPSKPEPAATIHDGEVVSFGTRKGFGLDVELRIPNQVYGNKYQLEWNGMKYVSTPMPSKIKSLLPQHGFFKNRGIDGISDYKTAASKESFLDLLDNHSTAFAVFGIDFLPDMTEFFFPGQRTNPQMQIKARDMLHEIATRGERLTVLEADEFIKSTGIAATIGSRLQEVPSSSAWVDKLADLSTTEARIAASMIIYLMTPGAKVEHVLRSGGFNDDSNTVDGQSRLMPYLFTQTFDNAPLTSQLRKDINTRINEQLYNPNADGTGYILHLNWDVEVRTPATGKAAKGVVPSGHTSLRGRLQFPEVHASGDNPAKNGMSFDPERRTGVSQHSAQIAFNSINADTAYAHDISKARIFAEGVGVRRFRVTDTGEPILDGSAWDMLTDIPALDRSFSDMRSVMPLEAEQLDLNQAAKVQYRQAVDTKNKKYWSDKERQDYSEKAREITRVLHLKAKQVGLVDFWVRQTLGQPYYLNENGEVADPVTGAGAVQAAQDILDNVREGYLPTLSAMVPVLHLHDLQAIFRANKSQQVPWRPRESFETDSEVVKTWDDWVKVSFGSALTVDTLFDPLFTTAADGFLNDYQNAIHDLGDLPVSLDAIKSVKLMDEEMNHMFVSMNPRVNTITSEPVSIDVAGTTIDDLLGGRMVAGVYNGRRPPADAITKRRNRLRAWRLENGMALPVEQSMRNFRKNGEYFVNTSTTTNALIRVMINLRVTTALVNPILYMSMGPEQWVRGSLDRLANLLTLQATTGFTANRLASVSEKLDGTRTGAALEAAGLTYRYTPDQLDMLNGLYRALGENNEFKSMVFRELTYLRPGAASKHKIEKFTEMTARFGSHMQDPTFGMAQSTLARRYLEAALQHIAAAPTVNVISTENLVARMQTNPHFLQNNFPEAHAAAMNSVAQIRSLKETTLSQFLKGIYEPMANSSSVPVNLFGNIVLKIPMLFSGYAMNVAVSIMGLQGLDQALAMFLEGRSKGPGMLFGRIQAKLAGKEFDPKVDGVFDMKSVVEGVDLSRSFVRGGLTHAGLFTFGLMAGGLGLSGEDDEMRKRRKLAHNQGVGVIYDPTRVESDFRNADAIYLDALPFGIGHMFQSTADDGTGRTMVAPHWMIKQFLSPIMGFEKFYETGDFRNITWGFEDALGSFPLINTMGWADAVHTAGVMAGIADKKAAGSGDDATVEGAGWLTKAVGVYERMLFENSFVNQMYIGFDEWDRDPYVLPLRDSDGTLQRDIEGNTRPNDFALQNFIDPKTGEVASGYLGRNDDSAARHVLSENRATYAAVASLFTGLSHSDYWRYNMPIKTRTIEKNPITQGQAEAYLLGAFHGQELEHNVQNMTEIEATAAVKTALYDAYNKGTAPYPTDGVVARLTKAVMDEQNQTPATTALLMSTVGKDGREHLTEAGARAVFQGLYKGTVKFGDPSLAGVYITPEMRTAITDKWTKELTQEGIDMGLDQTKAVSRMKRIMYGDFGDSTVPGLNDLIWSKADQISYSDSQTYGQLNTTYIIGPDGKPSATGFERHKLMSALGLQPFDSQLAARPGTGQDSRMNTTDLINNQNTGLRALVPLNDTRNVPTDREIGDKIVKAIQDAAQTAYTPLTPFDSKSGGYNGYRHYGYGHSGHGGGGGGGGGSAYFVRMNPLPDNVSPYGNSTAFINTGNPIIRRADIRRERVWSERGRLKQWQ